MIKAKQWLRKVYMVGIVAVLSACGVGVQNTSQFIHTAETIVWGVDVESGVFGHMDVETNQVVGFDIDIATAITKEILGPDATPTFVEVIGKTRVPMLKTHVIDAVAATLTITEERQKVIDFSDSYFEAGQALLVENGSAITRLEDMTREHVLVMVKGTTSQKAVKEVNDQVQTLEFESYAEAFVALKSGQGDAMTSDNSILFAFAVEDPNYKVLPTLFSTEQYGLAVDKGQPELLQEINDALATIKRNGVYQEISDRWIPTEKDV